MKKKTLIRLVIGLFIVGVLGGVGTYIYVFHKPHRNIEKEKPAYIVTAQTLHEDFAKDEVASYNKYGDKVIQVSGEVVEYSMNNDAATIVFISQIEGVSCSFEAEMIEKQKSKMQKIKVGDKVTLKGKCDGYDMIMGIVLTRCVII